jgi:hypothetical protein
MNAITQHHAVREMPKTIKKNPIYQILTNGRLGVKLRISFFGPKIGHINLPKIVRNTYFSLVPVRVARTVLVTHNRARNNFHFEMKVLS